MGFFRTVLRTLRGRSNAMERRLLDRCLDDREQTDRLIGLEVRRHPGITRERAAQFALERWNRDR